MTFKPEKLNRKDLLLIIALIGLIIIAVVAETYVFQPTKIIQTMKVCNESEYLYVPVFENPDKEIAELSDAGFTEKLYNEATLFEPLLKKPGTQVHMGYWSGKDNHGSLVRLIDSINNYVPSENESPQKAIWDEGVQSSLQYPSYIEMNARKHWYERAYPKNGKVTIYGVEYEDPYNVTVQQANDIWGLYSQRYANMAVLIKKATGKPVQVWCFVQGANPDRVFYKYEYPELKRLELQGVIEIHFAKTMGAVWKNPDDWSNEPIAENQ
jgi:hypothetical protein